MIVEDPGIYNLYLDKLSEITNVNISTYCQLLEALKMRHDYFASLGCKLSDHGLCQFNIDEYTSVEIDQIFIEIRSGNQITVAEQEKFKSSLLFLIGP